MVKMYTIKIDQIMCVTDVRLRRNQPVRQSGLGSWRWGIKIYALFPLSLRGYMGGCCGGQEFNARVAGRAGMNNLPIY
jgi:hypothetical protein